jgi:hypothetical protein
MISDYGAQERAIFALFLINNALIDSYDLLRLDPKKPQVFTTKKSALLMLNVGSKRTFRLISVITSLFIKFFSQ